MFGTWSDGGTNGGEEGGERSDPIKTQRWAVHTQPFRPSLKQTIRHNRVIATGK